MLVKFIILKGYHDNMKYILLFICLMPLATAIGVGPAQVYKVYSPGTSEKVTFTILNDAEEDLTFKVAVRGEGFISCEEGPYTLTGQSMTIACTLTHPTTLSPGTHSAEVVVSQVKPAEEGIITAVPAAVSRVRLEAQRQGIYAEGKLEVQTQDTMTSFLVYLYNFGNDNIRKAYAEISVDNDTIRTDTKSIGSMSEAVLTGRGTIPIGSHTATAVVHYDDKTFTVTKDFIVGEKRISITNVSIDPFRAGDIARIRLTIQNEWPELIENVHGEVIITKDNRAETLLTETFIITDTHEVSAFWNTANRTAGVYNATAVIYYDGTVASKPFTVTLPGQESEKGSAAAVVLAALILVAILVIIYLTVRTRPRKPQDIPPPPKMTLPLRKR
jgi:hypothetical protein